VETVWQPLCILEPLMCRLRRLTAFADLGALTNYKTATALDRLFILVNWENNKQPVPL